MEHIAPHLRHGPFSTGPLLRNMTPFINEHIRQEPVYRLDQARVVFANHALLQHDFPQLADEALEALNPALTDMEPERKRAAIEQMIEDWLWAHTAFISCEQALRGQVNTPIPVREETVRGHRPYFYGRALIYSVSHNMQFLEEPVAGPPRQQGLLDVKGVGVRPGNVPTWDTHSDGLMRLAEAFREVIFQELIDKILCHHGINCRTVPCYGVIDPGFDMILKNHFHLPAGLLIRRAHRRPIYKWAVKDPDSPEVPIEKEVELTLRRYGITSTGWDTILSFDQEDGNLVVKYGENTLAYSPQSQDWIIELTGFQGERLELEGINLQFTREVNEGAPQIIDFGGFWHRETFENPLVSLVACRPVRLGEIIKPGEPKFVTPDPEVRPPLDVWGKTGEVFGFDQSAAWQGFHNDNQELLCLNLARRFRDRELTGRQVREYLDRYIQTAVDRFSSAPI
ncbi:MAG: hypothetical protein QNK37_26865 [Acidobacteriota bacterium]|nr:hypothetical protein [Acidobacteriota bacterium]